MKLKLNLRVSLFAILILMGVFIACDSKNPTENDDSELKPGTIKDVDGNVYKIVQIGEQWWMAENLKVTHYRNGNAIPNVATISNWTSTSTGALCSYDNDKSKATVYGRLYNYFAVNDPRGLAPKGWHVPSDKEWQQLEIFLGMSNSDAIEFGLRGISEGDQLKEKGNKHWTPRSAGTNTSGFTALPGGLRDDSGFYGGIGDIGIFWTSTEGHVQDALIRYVQNNSRAIYRDSFSHRYGFSVRCVRDK